MKTNKSVLVSGGTGFIGSHTAVELINAGYSVVIVDNLSNSEATVIDGIERITGQKIPFENVDTCDLKALRGVFERHDFDSVIHFAAFKAVGGFDEEYFMYVEDADLTQKMRTRGKAYLVPQYTAIHAWHRAAHRSLKPFLSQLRSLLRYFSKWGFAW